MTRQKHILVAPLNWGLGHATRCIPLIHQLEAAGARVSLASDGLAAKLLEKEFPNKKIHQLASYHIRYRPGNMVWNIGRQLPIIARAILFEHRQTTRLIQQLNIDGIISDNRYGVFHRKVPSIFLSHQLNLRIPGRLLQTVVRSFHFKWLKYAYRQIWIPDYPGLVNLSGELGHDLPLKTVRYIGPLSRLSEMDLKQEYEIVVLLSGPEPQRSLLAAELLDQLIPMEKSTLFIHGTSTPNPDQPLPDHIKVIPLLTSLEVNKALLSGKMIVARSGYSTIMDLVKLGRNALLIPTPGQTEQEYLAQRLMESQSFLVQNQGHVNLKQALEGWSGVKPFTFLNDNASLASVVEEWLTAL